MLLLRRPKTASTMCSTRGDGQVRLKVARPQSSGGSASHVVFCMQLSAALGVMVVVVVVVVVVVAVESREKGDFEGGS